MPRPRLRSAARRQPGSTAGFVSDRDELLIARDCDWKISILGWMYTLFFVFLGSSAAVFGAWVERVGARPGVIAGKAVGNELRGDLGRAGADAEAARRVLFGQRAR